MKKFIFLLLALLCAVLAAACTKDGDNGGFESDNEQNKQQNLTPNDDSSITPVGISAEELYDATKEVNSFGQMQLYSKNGEALDNDTAAFFFGTLTDDPDMSLVSDYILAAAIGFSSDEIGIFALKNADDAETVKGYFNTRIENLKEKFKDYSAEEYEKASAAVVGERDNYVWYIVSSSASAVNDAIIAKIDG